MLATIRLKKQSLHHSTCTRFMEYTPSNPGYRLEPTNFFNFPPFVLAVILEIMLGSKFGPMY